MPARRLPWIKLWPELIDSEKTALLPDPEFRTWVYLLLKASQQTIRWRFASVEHAALITGRPAKHVRALLAAGLLDAREDGLWVHDSQDWQDVYPSDFEDGVSATTPRRVRQGPPKDGGPLRQRSVMTRPTLRDDSANAPPTLRDDSANAPPTLRDDSVMTPPSLPETSLETGDRDGRLNTHTLPTVVCVSPGADAPDADGSASAPEKPLHRATAPKPGPVKTLVDEAFEALMVAEFGPELGADWVRDEVADALNHKARLKYTDQQRYVRNWLRNDRDRVREKGAAAPAARASPNGHANGSAAPSRRPVSTYPPLEELDP